MAKRRAGWQKQGPKDSVGMRSWKSSGGLEKTRREQLSMYRGVGLVAVLARLGMEGLFNIFEGD